MAEWRNGSEAEVQNLQLSMEQISTSPSSNYLHSAGDDVAGVHISPPTSVRSTSTGASGGAGGKTQRNAATQRNKRRTSPYPAPSPPATVTPTAPVASASIISANPLMHDEYNNQLANMAPMDYRYDLQPSSSNQYLTSAMYSAYNANEVHLYSYGANGEAHADLYPSYYNNEASMYTLRHYPTAHTMPEGTRHNLIGAQLIQSTLSLLPLLLRPSYLRPALIIQSGRPHLNPAF